jgi:hypothetical protein
LEINWSLTPIVFPDCSADCSAIVPEEKVQLKAMVHSASSVSPYLFIWAILDSMVLLPFLARFLDRQRKKRAVERAGSRKSSWRLAPASTPPHTPHQRAAHHSVALTSSKTCF